MSCRWTSWLEMSNVSQILGELICRLVTILSIRADVLLNCDFIVSQAVSLNDTLIELSRLPSRLHLKFNESVSTLSVWSLDQVSVIHSPSPLPSSPLLRVRTSKSRQKQTLLSRSSIKNTLPYLSPDSSNLQRSRIPMQRPWLRTLLEDIEEPLPTLASVAGSGELRFMSGLFLSRISIRLAHASHCCSLVHKEKRQIQLDYLKQISRVFEVEPGAVCTAVSLTSVILTCGEARTKFLALIDRTTSLSLVTLPKPCQLSTSSVPKNRCSSSLDSMLFSLYPAYKSYISLRKDSLEEEDSSLSQVWIKTIRTMAVLSSPPLPLTTLQVNHTSCFSLRGC